MHPNMHKHYCDSFSKCNFNQTRSSILSMRRMRHNIRICWPKECADVSRSPRTKSRLSLRWSLLMLLATQSQSPLLTSMKQQPNGEYIFHFVFLVCFCSMWFVAGVGQVYFILSLFNSVPANNYSFTIESENWWKSAITAIYNNQTFLQLGKSLFYSVTYIKICLCLSTLHSL